MVFGSVLALWMDLETANESRASRFSVLFAQLGPKAQGVLEAGA
jgi:hypothetical protein